MNNEIAIHLEGLNVGKHVFVFELDHSFFEALEYSLIPSGNIKVSIEFNKTERISKFSALFEGTLNLNCDRCGELFKFPENFSTNVVLKFSEEELLDDGIWEIPYGLKELNLQHFIYETLCLAIPIRLTHEDSADGTNCSSELLKSLEMLSPSAYMEGEGEEKEIDPRWEALNKIKNK